MRTKWVALAVAVLGAAAVLAAVLLRGGSDVAPTKETGPDVFRLHPQQTSTGGQRRPESISYAGTTFVVGFGGATETEGRPAVGLTIVGPAGSALPYTKYAEGQTIEIDGAKLRIVAIHDAETDAGDLVDVRIVPVRTSTS